MRKALVWLIAAMMIVGVSAIAVAKHGPKEDPFQRVLPMDLRVRHYIDVGLNAKRFELDLTEPGTKKSNVVTLTLISNDETTITITETFTAALMKEYGLRPQELEKVLDPRLIVGQHRVSVTYSLPRDEVLTLPVNPGEHKYSLQVQLNWNREAEWWKVTPVNKEMGAFIITVASN